MAAAAANVCESTSRLVHLRFPLSNRTWGEDGKAEGPNKQATSDRSEDARDLATLRRERRDEVWLGPWHHARDRLALDLGETYHRLVRKCLREFGNFEADAQLSAVAPLPGRPHNPREHLD
eukprot:scaffold1590_cov239-Pinguiococcus_pyrenoidosus.AAC.11